MALQLHSSLPVLLEKTPSGFPIYSEFELTVTVEVMDRARSIMDERPDISARDAVHAAVYELAGARGLCSYDRDFDRLADIRRIAPDDLV